MYTVLIVFHVLLAAALIAVVLVQRGPGATMGAAFGSGASGTVFGSRGATGFLTQLTSWLGVAFFVISLSMAVIAARSGGVAEQADDLGVAAQLGASGQEVPASEEAGGDAAADDEFLELPVEGEETEDDGEASADDEFSDLPVEGEEAEDRQEPPVD
ncbi:MAG: preprotein translocase subunit SecG [Pseudomonadota bacterium]|nr:MAG: preprotein translocase subunit SecG [Pseudomonadota bacterium]